MANNSKPKRTIRIPQDPELRALRSSLDEARQRHGANSFEALEVLGNIEAFYENHGNPSEALRTCDLILKQLDTMRLSKSDWAFEYLLRQSYFLLLLARPEEAEAAAKAAYEGIRNLYGSCCTEILFALRQYLEVLASNGKTMSVNALGEKYLHIADELYRQNEPEWIRSRIDMSSFYSMVGREKDARTLLLSVSLTMKMDPALRDDIVLTFEDTYFSEEELLSSPLPGRIRELLFDLPVPQRQDPLSLSYTLLSVAAEHNDSECCAFLCQKILDQKEPVCEEDRKRYQTVRIVRDALNGLLYF